MMDRHWQRKKFQSVELEVIGRILEVGIKKI